MKAMPDRAFISHNLQNVYAGDREFMRSESSTKYVRADLVEVLARGLYELADTQEAVTASATRAWARYAEVIHDPDAHPHEVCIVPAEAPPLSSAQEWAKSTPPFELSDVEDEPPCGHGMSWQEATS